MNWTFAIQQKIKAAAILFGIMLMIVIFSFLERKNMADINKSVTSIYNDRLVPATDIFYLSEHLYGKRFLLEQFLLTNKSNLGEVQAQLDKHNQEISELITRFEKTYLVDEESRYLKNLKNTVLSYNRLEADILTLSNRESKKAALALYESKGRNNLQDGIRQLALLTRVQTNVGSQLIKDSNGKVASSSMISNLQIILSIVTGLVVISLVFASRISSKPEQNYHLN
ncbi:MCP four helix bundle domain-containing protein [Pararcticibacter amylolyticus]|uniref:Chemotaxis methyl-accepting receptor HlyB-like 4HB MCP domain-containing protein n=1 Tax=Pararcticibacter amylolyticus TaxID=2173175 RepID=A0A2U2PFK5_9SPHI|nr:MCP four helix bundle domain-containing protein [Pararcticibacter amylolyticus]PWG80188.1 hypothetical protein DDR33_13420 [Pararcticibacter amylolyticus]